jgi:hypothetical protein
LGAFRSPPRNPAALTLQTRGKGACIGVGNEGR